MTPGERLRKSAERSIAKFGHDGFLVIPTAEPDYDSTTGDYDDTPERHPIKYLDSPSEQDSPNNGLAKFKYSELTLFVDESIGEINETCKLEGYDGSIHEFMSIKTTSANNVVILYEVNARTSI